MKSQRKKRTKFRRLIRLPSHPLASKSGLVSESRMLLYERIGPGTHPCWWCGTKIIWGPGTRAGVIVADHLDGNWRNNAEGNIVPACQGCNGTRWHAVSSNESHVIRPNGTRLRGKKMVCLTCKELFVARPPRKRRPYQRKYCSLKCLWQRPH